MVIRTTHVPRRSDTIQDHIRGDLSSDVADEQDRYQCVVLCAFETEILIQRIEFGVDKGIAVEEIEAVAEVNQRDSKQKLLRRMPYKYMIHS